jgi:hypothetical protein
VPRHRLFYAYLLTQLSCLVWGLRILLSGFRPIRSYYTRAFRLPGRSHSPVDTWVTDHLPHIGGILLLGTLIIFVGSLILFHTYLIATDQTNYEMLQLVSAWSMMAVVVQIERILPWRQRNIKTPKILALVIRKGRVVELMLLLCVPVVPAQCRCAFTVLDLLGVSCRYYIYF